MTNDTNLAATSEEQERSFGQSVVYWLCVYVVTIPILCLITGLIVKAALGWSSPY